MPHDDVISHTFPLSPGIARRFPRRALLAGAGALGLAGPLASATTRASAAPPKPAAVETFDAMPLGSPPTNAKVSGSAVVENAPFGPSGNRAVHLTDTSSTAQTLLTFDAPPVAARQFTLTLMLDQVQQGVFLAVQGTGAAPALGTWRFMIAPAYGKNVDGLVQVYDGSAWQRLGVIQDLTRRGATTAITIDAGLDAAVLRIGEYAFRTTRRASTASAITGIQVASSGTAPVGTTAWVDDLGMQEIPAAALADGVRAEDVITRYAHGTKQGWTQVALLPEGVKSRGLSARVHSGTTWIDGRISSTGKSGRLAVSAKLTDPDIGEHPITVTITDDKNGTVLSSQGRSQSVTTIPAEVIATETAPLQVRFPDAVRLADGTILVAYYQATAHTKVNGAIRIVRSSDQGATWSAPVTVLDSENDDRDPKLAVLADGTVLLSTFRTLWSGSTQTGLGVFVARSTDGGLTFPEVNRVDGAVADGSWEHGPALELPDGDVLQPMYGSGARVARSHDGGRSFRAEDEVMVLAEDPSPQGEYWFSEPNIVRLPDGELVMSIRTPDRVWGQETLSFIVRSRDDGLTWSEPEQTDLPTSSHHTLLAADGSVLLAWGNQWQDGRPTYVTRIRDPHGPWTGYAHTPLYNSGAWDQANPSSVQLDDGSFLTFGFDVNARTLVQLRHRG